MLSDRTSIEKVEQNHMKHLLACSVFLGSLCLAAVQTQAQFQNDDILIGRSIFADTLAVLRGGSVVADSFTEPFISDLEFDNTDGITDNAAGNLVLLNRGAIDGSVFIGATDGSGTATLVGDFAGGFPAFNAVSAQADFFSKVAVSPDNSKMAIYAPGNSGTAPGASGVGAVFLFDYDPSQVGVDNTMVLTNGRTLDDPFPAFGEGDIEWLDNDTLIIADGDSAFIDTIDLDGSGNFDLATLTRQRSLLGPTGGVQPLDGDTLGIAYNPEISPFVYLGLGDFAGGSASNYIWVLDPTQTEPNGDWKQVARARYDSAVGNTIRDAELLSNGDLVVPVFGGSVFQIDLSTLDGSACGDPADFDVGDGGCGGLVDDTGVTQLLDGDVAFDDGTGFSDTTFPLIGVARTATTVDVDLDDDGDVDGADFLLIQRTDPSLIPDWIDQYPAGSLTGVTAVPEPSSVALIALALVCVPFSRRK